jgi:hypothetical protein
LPVDRYSVPCMAVVRDVKMFHLQEIDLLSDDVLLVRRCMPFKQDSELIIERHAIKRMSCNS